MKKAGWFRAAVFPDMRLRWKEPREYVRLRDASETRGSKWWRPLPWVLLVAGTTLLFWYQATLNPGKDPPSFEVAVLLGLGLGVFLCYGVPRFNRWAPSEIKLFDTGCLRLRGQGHAMTKWEDVTGYDFGCVGEHPVLELHLVGGVLLLGIGNGPEIAKLVECLEQLEVKRIDT